MDDLQSEVFTLYRSHSRKRCSEYALVLLRRYTKDGEWIESRYEGEFKDGKYNGRGAMTPAGVPH